MSRVSVAVRIRPQLKREALDGTCAHKSDDTTIVLSNGELQTTQAIPAVTMRFDHIFDDHDDQTTVYEEAVQEMVDAALGGEDATVLAYGQTGSGKTHTTLGVLSPDGGICGESGMLLRTFSDLFHYADTTADRQHVVLALSVIEVYLDDVFDLLSDRSKLKVRDDAAPPAKPAVVCNPTDVVRNFQVANSFRSVTATKMNDQSSRSHAIFFIDIVRCPLTACASATQVMTPDGGVHPSADKTRITLVDLAGSERVKKSGVEGQAMVEATAINKSLSTLGTVINALHEGNSHVPYRDSKLTKILKPCFNQARSKVLLMGQVSPADSNFAESHGTLKFCDRVKGLKAEEPAAFIDPDVQEEYMRECRTQATLACDLRLARVACPGFRVVRARHVAAATGEQRADVTSRLLVRPPDEQAEALREAVAVLVEEHTAALAAAQVEHNSVAPDVEALRAEVEQAADEFETTQAQRMSEAKKTKKQRVASQGKRDELSKHIDEADIEMAQAQLKLDAAEATRSDAQSASADDPEWSAFEEDWKVGELNHRIVATFHDQWLDLSDKHEAYIITVQRCRETELANDNTQSSEPLAGASPPPERSASPVPAAEDMMRIIPDMVEFFIDRAVDVAQGVLDINDSYSWVDIKGLANRPRPAQFWDPPLKVQLTPAQAATAPEQAVEFPEATYDSSEEEASRPESPPPSAAPKQAITHAEAARTAREKGRQKKKGTVTGKIESEEANKHYLMTVYDSASLVHDLTTFLRAGTVMMKHGKMGDPHKKKVWIQSTNGVREIMWESVRPDGTSEEKDKSKKPPAKSIQIKNVAAVTLGATSKVFKRNSRGSNDPSFFLSFTIHLKDKSRTLDLVADSIVDFEAWVLGVCHQAQVDPLWSKPLDIVKDPVSNALGPREKVLCERFNIPCTVFVALRDKAHAHRDDVAMQMRLFNNDAAQVFESMGGIHPPELNEHGAVLMTKGELRYFANPFNVDIIRVCAMWEFLRDTQVIFDPNYSAPTQFGVNMRS